MRVKDIMRKDYAALRTDDSLEQVLEVFSERRIASAPVFDHGEFIGIISNSDIVRYFTAKESAPIWTPTGQVASASKLIAGQLVRKPQLTLTPDQPLRLVAAKIASSADCVPVMEGKAVAAIVSSEDLVDFYLAELAKSDVGEQKEKPEGRKKESEEEAGTDVDRILEIVRRDGETNPAKIAKELGISQKTVESLSRSLARHHLAEINFSFLNGMVIRRMEHGKK